MTVAGRLAVMSVTIVGSQIVFVIREAAGDLDPPAASLVTPSPGERRNRADAAGVVRDTPGLSRPRETTDAGRYVRR